MLEVITARIGNQAIVDNIDFTLKRGEMACILGPSGSGKSTLLNMLGVFYSDTMCDDTSAVKWYKKAVELNQPNAFRNLALCYRDGKGVKKNEKKAEELLKQAVEMGVEDAQNILEEMLVKTIIPTAKIFNMKYTSNVTQDNTLGVEFSFNLNVDGMLGKKVNISAVDTDECTRKSVLNKPCKSFSDPIECVWCERIKVEFISAAWKPYKVFILAGSIERSKSGSFSSNFT